MLVVHTSADAYVFEGGCEFYEGPSFFCESPVTLTGGGDNFNAGFCLGVMSGLGAAACLLLGNAASGYYVRYGKSANLDELKEFIRGYIE